MLNCCTPVDSGGFSLWEKGGLNYWATRACSKREEENPLWSKVLTLKHGSVLVEEQIHLHWFCHSIQFIRQRTAVSKIRRKYSGLFLSPPSPQNSKQPEKQCLSDVASFSVPLLSGGAPFLQHFQCAQLITFHINPHHFCIAALNRSFKNTKKGRKVIFLSSKYCIIV